MRFDKPCMSSVQPSEKQVCAPALSILLSAWAVGALLVLLLLSLFMPDFAGIGRTLLDLLPADISVSPIYTT
jgi:hypothetical protein